MKNFFASTCHLNMDVPQTVEIVMILFEADVLLAPLTNATSSEEMRVVTDNF